MASGWVSSAISPTQSRSFAWVVGALAVVIWLILRTLLIGPEVSYFDVSVRVDDLQGRGLSLATSQAHGAIEGGTRLDLDVGRAVDGGDLLPHRVLQVLFDRRLGLGVVDHGFPATDRQECG